MLFLINEHRRLLHLSLSDAASIKDSQHLIQQNIVEIRHALLKARSKNETIDEKSRGLLLSSGKNNDLSWWSWARYTDLQAHNSWLRATISAYGNRFQTNYWIFIRTSLPGLATQRAMFFELKLRSYALLLLSLSLPFASLSIRNIVPETSPLLIACKEGNVGKVISLFDRHKGSPNDITLSNTTPLQVHSLITIFRARNKANRIIECNSEWFC